jgi:putative glutamine amidotransferase
MSRPVIGVIANAHTINDDYHIQGAGELNLQAVCEAAGALPLIVPANLDLFELAELQASCAGFIFTGGRPNVHPEEYGEVETAAHGDFDRNRDALVLPLIRACVALGQPILGICRGFQEVNVAFGGSLYPEIRDLPGRDNHRMPPDGTLEEKFAMRHEVTFGADGPFHRMMGAQKVMTNSLHGQGIKVAGDRIVVDGYAPDGTPEAIFVKDAPGFTYSVQWHPEWRAAEDSVSRPLFAAFGDACRAWVARGQEIGLKSA